MRLILRAVAGVAALYGILCLGLLIVLTRPPSQMGKAIAKIPQPLVMGALPFRPLYNFARGGDLKPGDAAPDFNLETVDHRARVRLSSFAGSRPVVLVFGSYT